MNERIAVRFPKELQEGTESMVSDWLFVVGDAVEENAPLLEISTDKVAVEIPSPATGILVEILKEEGDPVEVGEILGWIAEDGSEVRDGTPEVTSEVASEATRAPVADDASVGEIVDITFPEELREGTESMVGDWFFAVGDVVEENAPLLEISTDKVAVEIPSPVAGVLVAILKEEGDPVEPGEVVGRIQRGSAASTHTAAAPQEIAREAQRGTSAAPTGSAARVTGLSPAVKHLLKKHGLDPAPIQGTGAGGRITRADVLAYIETRPQSKSKLSGRLQPHDPIRKMVAHHMARSMQVAPHVTTIFQADMSAVLAHRRAHKEAFAEQGAKLTLTAYLVMASAKALQAVPRVNSRWHADHTELFDDCNIGVGTALGDAGLVVPVVHRTQTLDLFGIAERLTDLVGRARGGDLKPGDVQGGTFTISNHGVSGSLVAAPIIINQPQSAILGAGKLEKRVVVEEQDGRDTMVIRPMMYVTLTLDHRVLDAHQANRFMQVLVGELEGWLQE